MATLTLRLIKGSTLTFSETDNNFTALNNEKIERDGSIPFTGAQRFIAGTVSAPGITVVSDTDTGVYSPAADQIAITCGGTQRGLFSSSGLKVNQLKVNSSDPARIDIENTSGGTDSKNWSVFVATTQFQIRTYSDDYSSNTSALSIARSGVTAGVVQTYGSLLVGANQPSVGYMGLHTGGGSSSGYTEFYAPNGVRVGFIGAATTYGTGDNGTLPYIAGTHAFTGDVTVSGVISGNGSGLTSLNASNISSGTLADARLSSNVPLKNAANTFTANQTINADLTVSGTISGTLSGNGSAITSLNASNISSGTLADARLSSNVALKNAANTFTANQTLSVGASSILTINASSSPQIRLERSSSASNEKNWIIYADTASLQFRPYTDDYSSNTAALSIARSGVTAGAVQTYGNLYVGANQPSVGYMGLLNGGGSSSGYAGFYSPSGTRVGFIGAATTYGTGDNGTLPYVAGMHSFTGRANTVPVTVAFSTTPTFDSSLSNTIFFGTMTANVTSMTISNPVDGAQLQIRFVQDGTGGRTVTLPSNVQVSGSLNTAANTVTWLVLNYVSSASRWEGTWTRIS